eukprot:m.338285 g.338285  ORF g.338285 m.338285 type:complete len:76 (-) comp18371_c0_seq1:62-289(-)
MISLSGKEHTLSRMVHIKLETMLSMEQKRKKKARHKNGNGHMRMPFINQQKHETLKTNKFPCKFSENYLACNIFR